jgi:RNA polymerase sigma-70 factor (ECF subfamily)
MSQPPTSANHRFPTTQWTLVGRLNHQDETIVRRALDDLCTQYHYPLYCYIRSRGLNHSDAEDALHDFLAKLLRNHSFQSADPAKGHLRSFLAVALRNFLIDWSRQLQRAGKLQHHITAEAEIRYLQETRSRNEDPEILFDRKWALALIHRAIEALAASYAAKDKGPLFESLRPILLAGGSLKGEDTTRLASALGLKENTLRVAMSRLLREFRQALEREVLQTVSSPAEARAEIQHLLNALRHS